MSSSSNAAVNFANSELPPTPQSNSKKIAYIDFDGTIADSNCVDYLIVINRNLKNKAMFWTWRILLQLKAPLFIALHKFSANLFDKYYYRYYKGLNRNTVDKIIQDQVVPYISRKIFPQAKTEIDKLRSAGYHVVIVSGSLKNIIKRVAREIGAHDYIATQLEEKNGQFTGKIKGYNVNYQNKLRAIEEYNRRNNLSAENIIAYGNSKWDIPMLKFATESYAVNPDKSLANWSRQITRPPVEWALEKIPFRFYVLYAFLRPFMKHWEGLSNIPRNNGVIVVANHCSYLDHYIIGLTIMCRYNRRVRFLAKKEHFDTPLQRWIHRQLGAFPIDRNRGGKQGLLSVVKLLQRGEVVLIYPEGTRSIDGRLQAFKPGVLFTHFQSGCQIVPAGINGAYRILPKNKKLPRPGRITLRFGPAISFLKPQQDNSLPRGKERNAMLENLRVQVARLTQ